MTQLLLASRQWEQRYWKREFEPVFSSCESKLSGKKIAMFGSYGWGDGEWMRDWEERYKASRAVLV